MLTKKKARALVEDEKNWKLDMATAITRVLLMDFKKHRFARVQILSEPNPVYKYSHWVGVWSGELVPNELWYSCGRTLSLPQMAERIWEIDHD